MAHVHANAIHGQHLQSHTHTYYTGHATLSMRVHSSRAPSLTAALASVAPELSIRPSCVEDSAPMSTRPTCDSVSTKPGVTCPPVWVRAEQSRAEQATRTNTKHNKDLASGGDACNAALSTHRQWRTACGRQGRGKLLHFPRKPPCHRSQSRCHCSQCWQVHLSHTQSYTRWS